MCTYSIFYFIFYVCSPLTPEQRAEKNALVMFIIKDQDFMGLRNEFISETFVHFKDIPSAQAEDQFTCLPQIKLNMTVPKSLGRYLIFSLLIVVN